MLFYRVADEWGVGPFQRSDCITHDYNYAARQARIRLGHFVASDTENLDDISSVCDYWCILDHPSPLCGAEKGSILHAFWGSMSIDIQHKYVFGFVSLDQFKNVFPYTSANRVACDGYYLYMYDIDNTDIIQGYTQAVARKSVIQQATPIDRVPVCELEGHYD